MRKLFLLLILCLFSETYLNATTYHVRSDGNDNNDGLTKQTAFRNLTRVFGSTVTLANGDTVYIGSGTFPYNKQLTLSVSLTIKGAGKDSTFIQGTVADAGKRCFTIGSTSPATSPVVLIEDVTFRNFGVNGDPVTFANDGLIYFTAGTFTCRRVNFLNNQAYAGGAISVFGEGAIVLEDCYFKDNAATRTANVNAHGGAMNVSTSKALSLTIDRCVFESNTTEARGSALRLSLTGSVGSTVLIQNSTFTGNVVKSNGTAESGVIDIFPASASNAEYSLINNTIAYNTSEVITTGKAGINVGSNAVGKVTLVNNIFFAQTSASSISINIANSGLKESRNNITDTNFDFSSKTVSGFSSSNISNITGTELALDTLLLENGGETKTFAIGLNSIAKNIGYVTGVPVVDQRSFQRTGNPDVGSYEYIAWRSSLYPADWQPGYSDSSERFLHDFSYAGYQYGEPIPEINQNIVDVTGAPYYVDNTGTIDATIKIQQAINDVGMSGGGVVYLPPGEYALSIDPAKNYALILHRNNVILRGAGSQNTFLKNTTSSFRGKQVIYVYGLNSSWKSGTVTKINVANEIQPMTFDVKVVDVSTFEVGDLVIIGTDLTNSFIDEHGMTGFWTNQITGQRYCRYITEIDYEQNTFKIDIPIRYRMQHSDNPFVQKAGTHVKEVGLEGFSIGNVQNNKPGGWNTDIMAGGADDLAFMDSLTGAYEVHGTHFIVYRNALNSWARDISSYKPAENDKEVHFLSNAFLLIESRSVTVDNCDFSYPQYRGGGGNGYMFTVAGSDCLISNSKAKGARHNFSFKNMYTHGNVVLDCTGTDPRYASDFHMHLSMVNLFDNFISDGDYIEAKFRSGGGISGFMHGQTTTETVFWNTKGVKKHNDKNFLIDSRQYGWGYVIGTSGMMNRVVRDPVSGVESQWGTDLVDDNPDLNLSVSFDTAPLDFVEGVGTGGTLFPVSLYFDQLEKRRTRIIQQIKRIEEHEVVEILGLRINPQNELNLRLANPDLFHTCKVFDLNGKEILVHRIDSSLCELTFSIRNLNKGVYILRLYGDSVSENRKFVVY